MRCVWGRNAERAGTQCGACGGRNAMRAMSNVGMQRDACGDATRYVRGHAVRARMQRGSRGDAMLCARGRNAVCAGTQRCAR